MNDAIGEITAGMSPLIEELKARMKELQSGIHRHGVKLTTGMN